MSERWLSQRARALQPPPILVVARDVQRRRLSGKPLLDLTIGDFDTRAFPLPRELRAGIDEAIAAGQTAYPPMEGRLDLRQAIVEHDRRTHGIETPLESVLVASGARPFCYGTFECVLDPGDVVVHATPSWSATDYAALSGARAVVIDADPGTGFQPATDAILAALPGARLLSINTPLNPTGKAIPEDALTRIFEGVVRENESRLARDERPLFVLFDQVYGELVFPGHAHAHPLRLVPEARPFTVVVDAISKSLAATGLRVGWGHVPPALYAPLRDLVCHSGAWAPTPIQAALAGFLGSDAAQAHRDRLRGELARRTSCLLEGIEALRREGHPVSAIAPDGGLYVALRIDAIGRSFRGERITSDDAIRRLLLEQADLALIPFYAFNAPTDRGWFRAALAAAELPLVAAAIERLRAFLRGLTSG